MIRAAALFAFLAAVAPLAHAVYKWVDEKGVTHYSESPPPDGKAEKVELKPSGPVEGKPASPEMWKEREGQLRRERLEKERQEAAREKRDSAERKAHCARAWRQLRTLEAQAPVWSLNEKKEKVYISDADRAREIENWKKTIREDCPS